MCVKEVGRAASTCAALTLLALAVLPSSTAVAQNSAHTPAAPAPRALVDQYCVVCHNQKALTAGVSLEGIDFSNPSANAAIMERVLRKVRTGEMPHGGMPRSAQPALDAFTKSLESTLDQAAAAHPNPG